MPPTGGAARRAAVIEAERAKNEKLLLLDAGGSLTGDQNPAAATQGASSVELLNRLGYDAMALAPADLALGPEALAARQAEAEFPFLSANVYEAATGKLAGQPYVIKEIDGHRIALVGLTAAIPAEGFTIKEPLTALQEILPEVARQADTVILLSHTTQELDRLFADTFSGITAIIAGGSGPVIQPWVSERTGTPVLQADLGSIGHAGRAIAVTTLDLAADGKRTSHSHRQITLGPEVVDDLETAAWVDQQAR